MCHSDAHSSPYNHWSSFFSSSTCLPKASLTAALRNEGRWGDLEDKLLTWAVTHPARTRPAACRSVSEVQTVARETELGLQEEVKSGTKTGIKRKVAAPSPLCLLHLLLLCWGEGSWLESGRRWRRSSGQLRGAGCQSWSWTEAGVLPGLPGRRGGIPGRRMWFLGLNGAWAAAGGPWFVEAGTSAGKKGWGWGCEGPSTAWCGRHWLRLVWSCGHWRLGPGPRFWGPTGPSEGCGRAGNAAWAQFVL